MSGEGSALINKIVVAAGILLYCMNTGLTAWSDVLDPTNLWTVVSYASPNQFDYADDQQTGNKDSDIVGDSGHAAFYVQFDDLGTSSLTDGVWSARVRLGSDAPQTGTFDNNLFVGIDGNLDGTIDLFVGVDSQGSNARLAIWDPGSGANTSPDSTTIVSPAVWTTNQTAVNFDFSGVDLTNDPTATDLDLDNDGDNDFFLSFSLDFAEIVNQMNLISGLSIDEQSQIAFVLATANNDNSLNQDLNGANGGIGSSLTWGELGVLSTPGQFNPNAIPEPASLLFVIGSGVAWMCAARRRNPR